MHKQNRILFVLAGLKLVLPFFLQNPVYEPHRDEFLYLAEGSHMSFGFMEVPPLLSVFAWLTHLLGDGMFWIKFWPSLVGALNFILAGKIILSLGGKWFSLFLLFLCFFFGAYLRVHFLFQPNFLEIFFYTLIGYGLIRYKQTLGNKWLYVTGIGMGLGMLSKYSVAFYIFSILLALAFKSDWKIYRNKHLYYAGALGFLLFLPNGIWQYGHHFPVIFHMNELTRTQLQYVNPNDFLKEQIVMFLPCCFIWVTGLLFLAFAGEGSPYRFLARAFVFVIAILLIFHGKGYYSLGLYPMMFAFGCYALEKATTGKLFFLRFLIPAVSIFLGIYMTMVLLPLLKPAPLAAYYEKKQMAKTGLLRWEDQQNHALPQDFADMLGWEEMARKMGGAYATLDSNEQKNTILFCDDYGMAGAVNFYRKKYHLPEPFSDNASFLYWIPDSLKFENLVLLTDDQQEMQHDFIKEFRSARLYDSVTTPFARERGDLVIVLKSSNDRFRQFFAEKLEKDKRRLFER
jgi:Dolichyl-phosphate-mannose-protein mannosyltransferase